MKTRSGPRGGLMLVSFTVVAFLGLGVGLAALTQSEDPAQIPYRTPLSEGRGLLEDGKIAEARKVFEAALRRDPKDIEAIRGLALCARDDGDDESALAYLHQLTKLAPKDRAAWRNLALCAARLGRDMEALSAAQTALSLAPEGDKGMSDLVSRVMTNKNPLEGDLAGDKSPLPGGGNKGGFDPMSGVKLPEPPDPRKNLPAAGRDR